VAHLLIRSSEAVLGTIPTLPSASAPAAIIVLATDARRSDTHGDQDIVGPLTLERIAAAARQQRRLGLPILVSGGLSEDHKASLAPLMSQALEEDFGLSARWREERSRNTFENASFSAAILLGNRVRVRRGPPVGYGPNALVFRCGRLPGSPDAGPRGASPAALAIGIPSAGTRAAGQLLRASRIDRAGVVSVSLR
jgi:hypothetical protein